MSKSKEWDWTCKHCADQRTFDSFSEVCQHIRSVHGINPFDPRIRAAA